MNSRHERTDLAAYALAALDQPETAAVGSHLESCAPCRAELTVFATVVEALTLVPPDDALTLLGRDVGLPAGDDDGAADESPAALSGERLRVPARGIFRGARLALAAAVAGVLLGAVAQASTHILGGDQDRPVQALPTPLAAGQDRVRSATAPTGVQASVASRTTGWGTELALDLTRVQGPQRCRLVVVGKDGRRETALNWAVPPAGYGLPGSAKPALRVTGGTSLAEADIAGFAIETDTGRTLVRIPV